MRTVPWWGFVSAVLAPVLLVGGWSVAAYLQPVPFDPVSSTISALAAYGEPYRWLMTAALLGVGLCDIATGIALRPAAEAGRVMLMMAGTCGILLAVNPQPRHGASLPHIAFAFVGVVLATLWPVAAVRREPDAPHALRPGAAYGCTLIAIVLLLWFTAELLGGPQLGLAERAVTGELELWPLVVVMSVLDSTRRAVVPAIPRQTAGPARTADDLPDQDSGTGRRWRSAGCGQP